MSLVLPLSTVHEPLGYTAADILTVMSGQFAVSTKFQIDVTATGGVTNGFSVYSITDNVPRYIFRRTGAQTIAVSIQPSGGCSSIGDTTTPPTVGTPSIWSSEKIWTINVSTGLGSIVLMSEVNDAFFVMITSTARTSFLDSCAIGRLWEIDEVGDIELGRDGLGLFVGLPSSSSTGSYWWNNMTPAASRYNLIRLSNSMWGGIYGSGTGSAGTASVVGFERPCRMSCNVNSLGASNAQFVQLKYIRIAVSSAVPRTVVFTNNASNQGWIHITSSTSATTVVIPWDRTIVPDIP